MNIKFPIIVRTVFHEPLVHFFLIATLIFLAGERYREHVDVYRISISRERITQLENRYAMQFGAQPDGRMLNRLVENDIHDEILFREGLSLKLDKDDEIVRRRIVQKTRFFIEDVNAPPEPSEADLKAYYSTHAQNYLLPARATFRHIFFSQDIANTDAHARALAALIQLSNKAQASGIGDPFPDHYDFSNYSLQQVNRIFGRNALAEAVFTVPIQQWAGPFQSAYGWHLIYVQARSSEGQQLFSAIRDKVRADYLIGVQDKANKIAFNRIAKKYTVIREQK